MNSTPKRFGNAPPVVVSAKAGSDSSQGNAIATPAPRRMVRREIRSTDFFVCLDMLFTFLLWGFDAPFVQELGTGHDGFHQWTDTVAVSGGGVSHLQDGGLVRKHQRAAQRVREQLAADIVDELVLAVFADVG